MSIASASAAGCGHLCFPSAPEVGDASPSPDGVDAAPAIGWLQSPGLVNNAGVGNAVSATFGKPVAAGNTIIAFAWTYAPGGQSSFDLTTISDTAGNTYALPAFVATPPAACPTNASSAIAIFVATSAATATPLAVTVTPLGPTTQEVELYIAEYAGVTAVDQGKIQQVAGFPSPMIVQSGPTMNLSAVPNELVVGAATTCEGSPDAVAWADNAGLTSRDSEVHTQPPSEPGIVGDRVVTDVGLYFSSWTLVYAGGQYPSLAALVTLR